MGCCTLPSSTTKGPKDAEREYWLQNEKIRRSTIQQMTKAWLHSPVDDLGVGFEDEVRPANNVSNKINIYKVAASTNIDLCDIDKLTKTK